MNNLQNVDEKETVAREIAKTSKAIRKKHRALKVGKMDVAETWNTNLQPVVDPLKQLVKNTISFSPSTVTSSSKPVKSEKHRGTKRRLFRSSETSTPATLTKVARKTSASRHPETSTDSETSYESSAETVFETPKPSTLEKRKDDVVEEEPVSRSEAANDASTRPNLGPLSREYLRLLSSNARAQTDNVYGVYYSPTMGRLMIGNSVFDVDANDNVLINDKIYEGTRGLYELLFKKVPNSDSYTDADLQAYKSILLATSAHKRGYVETNPVMGNRGRKYKDIIASLFKVQRGHGMRTLPVDPIVTDNAIDYVHWDDPNELVDRLRLITASQFAGHTGHDNEIVSILEELREAGLVIN